MAEPQQDRREKPAGESGSPVSHMVLKHLGGAKEGAGGDAAAGRAVALPSSAAGGVGSRVSRLSIL